MAKKISRFDRTCTICGKKYEYCATCSKFSHLPRWMDAYCSENCKDLYNITAGWANNWLDKDVEIARLEKCDLTNIDKYPQWMRDIIKEMQSYKPQVSAEAIEQVLFDVDVKDEKSDKNVEKKEIHKTQNQPSNISANKKQNEYKKNKIKNNE